MIILTHEILEQVTDNNAFIILVKSIAKRASFDTNQSCFPGTSLMCKDTGLSRSSVIRARKWLETNGFIKIVKKGKTKDSQYLVNEYSIKTNLIKVVGNLKSDGVVSEVDGGSVTENLPSVTEKLGVVSQMDSNLKSNITSSPVNGGPPPEKSWEEKGYQKQEFKKSQILKVIEKELPELSGTPILPIIIKTLNQKEAKENEKLELIRFVAENKKDKIFEIKGWKFWFWDDFVSEKSKNQYKQNKDEETYELNGRIYFSKEAYETALRMEAYKKQ